AGSLLVITLAVAFTPLAQFWFGTVSGLGPELTALAILGSAWALLWPAIDAFRNLIQGVAVYARRTAAISASMILFLIVSAGLLALGVITQRFTALPTAMVAFVVATLAQVTWLWWQVRVEVRELAAA
ncbi:MAG TPA: hypothetical protein PLT07_12770, partial [Trueperaceae bacterium]|nr:hypothetical protein [Trueperaceae bacterium]